MNNNMSEVQDILTPYQTRSRGYIYDPIAAVFDRILLGPGLHMTPQFMRLYSITHIINCADETACPNWTKTYLGENHYECLDAIDSENVNIINDFYSKFEKIMDSYLRDPTCSNVYVHCQAGMNRSATLAIAYVHKRFGIPMLKLIESTVRQRPCILSNTAFQKQLLEFASHKNK